MFQDVFQHLHNLVNLLLLASDRLSFEKIRTELKWTSKNMTMRLCESNASFKAEKISIFLYR